jgi:hypothetical protein
MNSALLNKLKYYPIALLLIIVLFAGSFFFKSTQNKLWAGMAKETASNRDATFFTNRLGRNTKADNIEESTTLEIERH